MAHPLEKLIEERKASLIKSANELRALEQHVAILRAEISAYEDAMKYVLHADMPRKNRIRSISNSGPKGNWDAIFKAVGESGKTEITYADIMNSVRDLGVDVKEASLRATMMKYANEGVFTRVRNGVFSLTEKGKNMYPTRPNDNDIIRNLELEDLL